MNYTLRLQRSGRTLFLLLVFMMVASAALGQKPDFKLGELLVVCQPGTQQADVNALLAKVNGVSVEPLMPDCYKFVLKPAFQTEKDTLDAVSTLKLDPRVRWTNPNMFVHPRQQPPKVTPNDPRYTNGDQWGLLNIRAAEAWALQKGGPNANYADIDSGFAPLHEDMVGQYLKESFNFDANTSDITFLAADTSHGAHTSSIINAHTDNGIGMAGVCWENVKCLGLKALEAEANIIKSYQYIVDNKAKLNIVAVNMSYGFIRDASNASDMEFIGTKAMADAGVVCVGAGAEGSDPNANQAGNVPNVYPHVLNVVALNRANQVTAYNRFGADKFGLVPRVDIAAPGGEGNGAPTDTNSSLGVDNNVNAYTFEDGTSFACPHVTGVVTLLMSVPGVTPAQAIKALKDGANKTHAGDPQYGAGTLDAYGALLQVSVSALITAPAGVDANGNPTDPSGVALPVQTLKPTLSFQLNNINLASVVIKIDGATILTDLTSQDAQTKGVTIQKTSPTQTLVSFRQQFSPGTHTIVVTGTNLGGDKTVSDTRTISVVPYRIPKGRSFLSFPYTAETNTGVALDQSQLLGSDFTLYRWSQKIGKYGIFPSSSPNSNLATFSPPDSTPTPADGTIRPPLGLAFFIDTAVDKDVLTYGQSFTDQPFRIPLQPGWNMVGDPFPFAVPFNTAQLELPTGQRLSIQQAADQKLVNPSIYRFVGGEYTFRTLPDGTFNPWEGHWIYMATNSQYTALTLVLSPTPTSAGVGRAAVRLASTRAAIPTTTTTNTNAPYRPKVEGPGSWSLRLVAHAKNLTDSNNFIGMTTRATDLSRVPKPPLVGPYVSLGIVRQEAPHVYAQDLQPIGGTKTWDVVVATDQANTDVVLTWPEANTLPRNVHLLLTDKVTGKVVDVARQSSYQFNTGTTPGTRAFTLTARPAQARGRALLTNVFVNPNIVPGGRAATTFEIGYTISEDAQVEISILSASGRRIAVVGATRDVPNGNNRALWNGRDSAGRVIGSGVYAVQLRAITSDGALTRIIQPFVNTGR